MTRSDSTLIIGAIPQEIALFTNSLERHTPIEWGAYTFHQGVLEEREILVVRSGVGKVLAAMITQYAISRFSPARIIFTGLAGSLAADLSIGDVVVAESLIQHDMDASALGFRRGQIPYSNIFDIPTDPRLRDLALKYRPNQYKLRSARILSGDQFIAGTQRAAMPYLTSELNGDCVEMEGASVALVAHHNQTACIVIRTISDCSDGSSASKFEEFLGHAAERSFELVRYILKNI